MTDSERDHWRRRMLEIAAELQGIAALRVTYAKHPDNVEDELLGELADIKRRLGMELFER